MRVGCAIALSLAAGLIVIAEAKSPIPPAVNKTIFVGRLAVEAPTTATSQYRAKFESSDVELLPASQTFEGLRTELDTRAAALRQQVMKRTAEKDAFDRKYGFDPDKVYAKTRLVDLSIDESKGVARIGVHVAPDQSGIQFDVYRQIEGRIVHLSLSGYDASRYQEVSDSMVETAEMFVPLASTQLPSRPGFVVDGGMFADKGKPLVIEAMNFTLTFPEHPDTRFNIQSRALRKQNTGEPTLSWRATAELGMLKEQVKGVRVLGRDSRKAGGQKGYWIGIAAPNDEALAGSRLRKFFWSADGEVGDVTKPFMEVEMMVDPTPDTGSSFKDDDQAEAFWNALLDSLRIRPGAV